MVLTGGIIAALIVSALAAAGASVAGSVVQANSAKEANEKNEKSVENTNQSNLDIANSTNQANLQIAREANLFSAQEAEKNRQFQLEMSNTAHQREVADMKAAGLNPFMSVAGNGAAVTGGFAPVGATARMEAARMQSNRYMPEDFSSGLFALSSLAQSAVTMMALSKGSSSSKQVSQAIKGAASGYKSEGLDYLMKIAKANIWQ